MLIDAVQMVIFLFGGFMGTIISLKLVGGISGLFNKLERDGLEQFPHLIRPATDDSFPWYDGDCSVSSSMDISFFYPFFLLFLESLEC